MLFNDLKDKYSQYKNSLITFDEFDSWVYENIEIQQYIPVIKKYTMLHDIDETFAKECAEVMKMDRNNMEILFVMYDMTAIFDILFRYTNIDIQVDQRTTVNYDYMVSSGLFDYLKNKIGADYDKFVSMFEKASGINELNVIKVIEATLASSVKPEDIESLEKLFKGMTPKKIKLIEDFQEFNNPGIKLLYDNMKSAAMKEADEKMKKNISDKE